MHIYVYIVSRWMNNMDENKMASLKCLDNTLLLGFDVHETRSCGAGGIGYVKRNF